MGKHAVNRRPLILIGGLAVSGLAATLAVTTPSAAGAQTRGHHGGFKVVADHLNNPRGLSPAPGGRHGPAAVPDRGPGGPYQVITG
jgi:hypothetical protein